MSPNDFGVDEIFARLFITYENQGQLYDLYENGRMSEKDAADYEKILAAMEA